MNPSMIVISPHLGDGVVALGCALAASPGSTIATVCTGSPRPDPTTPRAVPHAFEAFDRALTSGLSEDAEAVALLNCKAVHLDFFDERYELPRTPRLLRSVLADTISSLPSCQPVGPFGFGPPDHQLVSDCVLDAADQLGLFRLCMYEDRMCCTPGEPPEADGARRAAMERRGWHLAVLSLEDTRCDVGVSAKRAYRSRHCSPEMGEMVADTKVWLLRR
ncbi:MAG: LmbE-like protein [Ilumatobacteraceae bacterium]|nr:LmbE-like protein [Ilumatobacteraceae bacterium]MCU1388663.1 LmbE-like protein [Ilumatobacteraceae bacterium]